MCSAFQVSVYVMLAIASLAKINHKANPESGHEALLKIMEGEDHLCKLITLLEDREGRCPLFSIKSR